jgi:hypothetical protein
LEIENDVLDPWPDSLFHVLELRLEENLELTTHETGKLSAGEGGEVGGRAASGCARFQYGADVFVVF